jgi:hypothetical protein
MTRVMQLVLVLGVLTPVTLMAQQPASPSPAAVAGLTVSPKWGQGPDQQRQSEEECYGRARNDTGVDPAMFTLPDSTQADTFVAGVVNGRRKLRNDAQRADAVQRFQLAMRACLEGGGYTVQ